MLFVPSISPPVPEDKPAWLFLFSGQKILVKHLGESVLIPQLSDLPDIRIKQTYLGTLDGHPCHAAEVPENISLPEAMTFTGLRGLYGYIDDEFYNAAGVGLQISNWEKAHGYCGACGSRTRDKSDERAKICPDCGMITYPRISPAIIVAVIKDDQILLARSPRFPNSKMYSVLAGYVEVGETLEQCVKREVREEVSIEISNVRYFGSQPWHYSSTMMIGFTAEYAGGTIRPDEKEIADAGWYKADALPQIPGWGSIAGELIHWFVEKQGKSQNINHK